jgi:hypothetical protein
MSQTRTTLRLPNMTYISSASADHFAVVMQNGSDWDVYQDGKIVNPSVIFRIRSDAEDCANMALDMFEVVWDEVKS